MRTAFVQFDFVGVELSYECHYKTEPTGQPYDIEANLVMIGPDQEPPTPEQSVLYAHYGQVWHQFFAALEAAHAEKYREPDRDDVVYFGRDRY